jgi:hypothetical protein
MLKSNNYKRMKMSHKSRRAAIAGLLAITVLIFIAFAQIGCTGAQKSAESSKSSTPERNVAPKVRTPGPDASGQGEITPQAEFGNGAAADSSSKNSANQPGPNGTAPAPEGPESSGVTLPKGWPEDIPVIPEFTINVSADKGDGGLIVGASGKKSVTEVADFYKKLEGWSVLSDSITNPNQAKSGRSIVLTKKTATLSVVVEPLNSGTQLNLTYRKS